MRKVMVESFTMFLLGNIVAVGAMLQGSWAAALVGITAMVVAVAAQGLGHAQEAVPPEPFTGPGNAISRILLEQWLTFPRFVLSGACLRALRQVHGRRPR